MIVHCLHQDDDPVPDFPLVPISKAPTFHPWLPLDFPRAWQWPPLWPHSPPFPTELTPTLPSASLISLHLPPPPPPPLLLLQALLRRTKPPRRNQIPNRRRPRSREDRGSTPSRWREAPKLFAKSIALPMLNRFRLYQFFLSEISINFALLRKI